MRWNNGFQSFKTHKARLVLLQLWPVATTKYHILLDNKVHFILQVGKSICIPYIKCLSYTQIYNCVPVGLRYIISTDKSYTDYKKKLEIRTSRVTRSSRFCNYSNVVTVGHNELWQPLAANRLTVTSQMLWPLATTNCGGLWPQKLDLE